jgi:hypothetical protein
VGAGTIDAVGGVAVSSATTASPAVTARSPGFSSRVHSGRPAAAVSDATGTDELGTGTDAGAERDAVIGADVPAGAIGGATLVG